MIIAIADSAKDRYIYISNEYVLAKFNSNIWKEKQQQFLENHYNNISEA
jgi:hypothetical protein